jgi:hypothetical protein
MAVWFAEMLRGPLVSQPSIISIDTGVEKTNIKADHVRIVAANGELGQSKSTLLPFRISRFNVINVVWFPMTPAPMKMPDMQESANTNQSDKSYHQNVS